VTQIGQSGGGAVALPLDVADTASFALFREAVTRAPEENWGGASLCGLVNNAGFGLYSPIETVTEAQSDALFLVHLKGPFLLTQALLPLIREGGAIVNLTSATTRVATDAVAPYASFKGGLEVLTRYMAEEFGPRRIRANAVLPARSGPSWAAASRTSSRRCWHRRQRSAASVRRNRSAASSPACSRTSSVG
jgi:NAD(P)-dependent dehydrogenase (short-subunit alcohol dehydrogenase family)